MVAALVSVGLLPCGCSINPSTCGENVAGILVDFSLVNVNAQTVPEEEDLDLEDEEDVEERENEQEFWNTAPSEV